MSTPTLALPSPDPFKGMSGVASEAIKSTERLKIAILGKPKTGKSHLMATAPKPIRVYDFDDRSESLEGKPGLYILSRPTMLQVESDLSIMKANKMQGKPLPATIAFDSVTHMVRATEDEIRRQSPGLFKGIKVGNSTTVYKGKDWDVVVGVQRYIAYLISELTSLGTNFIFVYHERDEKDIAESTAEKTAFTGKITTNPQYLSESLSLFNEVYRITVDGNRKYQVTCRPNFDVNASTTMLLDPVEPPDIMAMIAKHKAKRAALPQNASPKE
jgi:hypothetical protein